MSAPLHAGESTATLGLGPSLGMLEHGPALPTVAVRPARRPELDALRGLFLVWMTLTHLPTRLSDFVNQPVGFISSAEGFVFLSAMLVAEVQIRKSANNLPAIRKKLWKRALHIYGYHLAMLAIAFTVAASYAVETQRPALSNLLHFYLLHPRTAVVGSVFLFYCPPLLDILPMYVIFLLLSPFVLQWALRRGWAGILAASGGIWLMAQFGLRAWVHNQTVHLTGLQIPLNETGAFNLFAWQAIWILGMWMGAKSVQGQNPFRKLPNVAFVLSAFVCFFFLSLRHYWLGKHLTVENMGLSLDKWQIGPLRMLNLFAFACVAYWLRRYVARLLAVEPLLTLGKASLEVFCAHVFFVFSGLALLYGEVNQLHGIYAVLLVSATFTGLILVAVHEVNRKTTARNGFSRNGRPPSISRRIDGPFRRRW